MGLFLSAEVGALVGERRQPFPQSGIVGIDACGIRECYQSASLIAAQSLSNLSKAEEMSFSVQISGF